MTVQTLTWPMLSSRHNQASRHTLPTSARHTRLLRELARMLMLLLHLRRLHVVMSRRLVQRIYERRLLCVVSILLLRIWSMVDMCRNSRMAHGTRRMTGSHGLRRRHPLCTRNIWIHSTGANVRHPCAHSPMCISKIGGSLRECCSNICGKLSRCILSIWWMSHTT